MTIVDKTFLTRMVKYTIILILAAVLFGCSPLQESPVTHDQIPMLEQEQAVADWKCSQGQTDECSSPAPIGWLGKTFCNKNWSDCCWQHDWDYNFGYKYGITRVQADYELWACVRDSGHPIVANLIYDGVKLFGNKFYHTGEK